MHIRPTILEDIPALQGVLSATELFPSEMLPEMIDGFLTGQTNDALWVTCESDGAAVGFGYAAPEQLTEGTWNMLAIAVDPSKQGIGCGGAIAKFLEEALKEQGHRLLIADTSGTDAFKRTRAFYRKHGYAEEARIRDFWAMGDDKVTFRKVL